MVALDNIAEGILSGMERRDPIDVAVELDRAEHREATSKIWDEYFPNMSIDDVAYDLGRLRGENKLLRELIAIYIAADSPPTA